MADKDKSNIIIQGGIFILANNIFILVKIWK